MLYTTDEINKRDDILPGITLGANIMDTCSRLVVYVMLQMLLYLLHITFSTPAFGNEDWFKVCMTFLLGHISHLSIRSYGYQSLSEGNQ